VRHRLEEIGRTFIGGYRAALEQDDAGLLGDRLSHVQGDLRGFAFEGAGMALALLDCILPWGGQRVQRFLRGPGGAHVYMVHVGAGWALARLHRPSSRLLGSLDPVLRWLAMDGYGFHEGYFHWPRTVEARRRPASLRGYARRAYDQGLGRSLWFVRGADVERIAGTIAGFEANRHRELWSGVGLASAYAGGVPRPVLEALRAAAGAYGPCLAQGAAFAAKARAHAKNASTYTDEACHVFCGLSAQHAAEITDQALAALPPDGDEPAFEVWRRRIQARFASQSGAPQSGA